MRTECESRQRRKKVKVLLVCFGRKKDVNENEEGLVSGNIKFGDPKKIREKKGVLNIMALRQNLPPSFPKKVKNRC